MEQTVNEPCVTLFPCPCTIGDTRYHIPWTKVCKVDRILHNQESANAPNGKFSTSSPRSLPNATIAGTAIRFAAKRSSSQEQSRVWGILRHLRYSYQSIRYTTLTDVSCHSQDAGVAMLDKPPIRSAVAVNQVPSHLLVDSLNPRLDREPVHRAAMQL